MQVKLSPMTCQNGCSELCKACRCCFHNKLVLRRSKWCFYSHTFNTRLRLLSLVAARCPCFFSSSLFSFFSFPAIRSLSHCPRCPRQPAFLQWSWYAFPLVCVPTLLRVEQRWRFSSSSSSSSKQFSGCLNSGVDHFWVLIRRELTYELCSCKPSEMRCLQSCQLKRPLWKNSSTCSNQIFQKCKFDCVKDAVTEHFWFFFFTISPSLFRAFHPFSEIVPVVVGWAGSNFRVGAVQI